MAPELEMIVYLSILSMSAGINIAALGNPRHSAFRRELANAHKKLGRSQAREFFRILTGHLEAGWTGELGRSIVECIYKILKNGDYMARFVKWGFVDHLPFADSGLSEPLLNVMQLLAADCPEVFTESVTKKFSHLIRFEPEKALVVIAVYATKFDDVEAPWPMLDLIFKHFAAFSVESLAEKFIALVFYLCQQYPEFREARGAPSWKRLRDLLKSKSENIILAAYYGMCPVCRWAKPDSFPIDSVLPHLDRPELQAAVLSVLLRIPNITTLPRLDRLIPKLLLISQRRKSACLLLMQMAREKALAPIFLDDSSWMRRELPERRYTLSLFACLAQSLELRPHIVSCITTPGFFYDLSLDGGSEFLRSVCHLIRRLPLTPEFVSKLSESGALKAYADSLGQIADDLMTIHSALLFYDRLGRICYVPDFDSCCRFLCKTILENDNELGIVATGVALTMAHYPSCLKRFKAKKLDRILNERTENHVMRKLAARFAKFFR
jgi:hypothetical protein